MTGGWIMNKKKRSVTGSFLIPVQAIFFIVLLISSITVATADAAKIVFTPDRIGVAIQQGEEQIIAVSTSFNETLRQDSYVNFTINSSSGNIPNSWLANNPSITLNSSSRTKEIPFSIKVPADARPGLYRGTFVPGVSRSNERVTFNTVTLFVEVTPGSRCQQPPVISETTSGRKILNDRNSKQQTLVFSGSINSPPGCTTSRSWYQLSDEYGEMDKTGNVAPDANGNFTVSVSVIASRKGDDKNGRHYSLVFGAENEAGIGLSDQRDIVITHDNRKK
jgi:hypothetical protein